jgi:hypothetical protein
MRKFAYVLQGTNSRPDIEPAGAKAETAIGRQKYMCMNRSMLQKSQQMATDSGCNQTLLVWLRILSQSVGLTPCSSDNFF